MVLSLRKTLQNCYFTLIGGEKKSYICCYVINWTLLLHKSPGTCSRHTNTVRLLRSDHLVNFWGASSGLVSEEVLSGCKKKKKKEEEEGICIDRKRIPKYSLLGDTGPATACFSPSFIINLEGSSSTKHLEMLQDHTRMRFPWSFTFVPALPSSSGWRCWDPDVVAVGMATCQPSTTWDIGCSSRWHMAEEIYTSSEKREDRSAEGTVLQSRPSLPLWQTCSCFSSITNDFLHLYRKEEMFQLIAKCQPRNITYDLAPHSAADESEGVGLVEVPCLDYGVLHTVKMWNIKLSCPGLGQSWCSISYEVCHPRKLEELMEIVKIPPSCRVWSKNQCPVYLAIQCHLLFPSISMIRKNQIYHKNSDLCQK